MSRLRMASASLAAAGTLLYNSDDTVAAVVDGVRNVLTPVSAERQWTSPAREMLHRRCEIAAESTAAENQTHWPRLVASVNHELDRRNIELNGSSAESLARNVEEVARGNRTITQAHVAEMSTFLEGMDQQGNNRHSCIVGVLMHGFSAYTVGPAVDLAYTGPIGPTVRGAVQRALER
jgi:hypothetical protein